MADLTSLGRWAVVTGASMGIGREIALRLAGLSLNVVLIGRHTDSLQHVAARIKAMGVDAMVLPLDLALPDAPRKVEEAIATLDVGVLVNCAGFGSGGDLIDQRLSDELAMVDVNCRAVVELTHRFARRFVERRRGAIVLLSSLLAFQGVARSANYAATKAYIQSLGEALAEELASSGVQVLTAVPGPTESGFADRAGMKLGQADSAAQVADGIVAALSAGKSRVVPGRVGKFLLYSLMTVPRFVRIRIMKSVMGSMTGKA